MTGLAAGLQAERDDNLGATPAREAAEALKAAAAEIEAAAGPETPLLAVALILLERAIDAAERLHARQLSAALLLEAARAAGRPLPAPAPRGLRLVR